MIYVITDYGDEIVTRSTQLRAGWLLENWKGGRRLRKLRDGQLCDVTEVEYEHANDRLHNHRRLRSASLKAQEGTR